MDNNYYNSNNSFGNAPMTNNSNAGTVQILGILSLFFFPIILAPIALILYRKGKIHYSAEDMNKAKAGVICSYIALGIFIVALLVCLIAVFLPVILIMVAPLLSMLAY